MALVQTDHTNELSSDPIILLKGAQADELSAQILYQKIAELIPEHRDAIMEIMQDEVEHQGKLQALIMKIEATTEGSSTYAQGLKDGRTGA